MYKNLDLDTTGDSVLLQSQAFGLATSVEDRNKRLAKNYIKSSFLCTNYAYI